MHHRDGDHHNNPPDGSNWEMLCIYCHENEHARYEDSRNSNSGSGSELPDSAKHRPLEKLGELLKKKK